MTDDTPLISVLIPCFNYARYVASAIESALSQDYARKEVIVVNDGSTDDSLAVISRYADRVRIIDQENRGAIATYNRSFEASRGAIVIFLDADDILEPGALSLVARAWSPSAAKVQYDLKIIDADGTDLGRRFCHFEHGYDAARVREAFRRTGTYRWPVTAGNAYSRWFLDGMFPLTVDHGPDGTLNTIAPIYGEVVTIPRVLGCYRLHGANSWSSDGSDVDRLPKRIHDRQREVAVMRSHAARRGVPVPTGNVLDHELPFITYRLIARRLGFAYDGMKDDSPVDLVWRACLVARAERLPLRLGLAHVVWCSVFSLSPRRVGLALVRLRYNRAAFNKSVRRSARSLGRRLTPWRSNPI
jgi:glycosyltransferase involved in cell wall biosynthesis